MQDVIIKYPTPEGYGEHKLVTGKLSFGRGSDADLRFADSGMSRLHATIYREGDKIWVVDENSSNGTFVNGEKVPPAGKALKDGDSILLGNNTTVKILFSVNKSVTAGSAQISSNPSPSPKPFLIGLLPALLIGLALTIVVVSMTFVVIRLFARSSETEESSLNNTDIYVAEKKPDKDKTTESEPAVSPSPRNESADEPVKETLTQTSPKQSQTAFSMPAGKKYLDLTDSERRQYIADRAMKIAQIIGNSSSEPIPPEAIEKIKSFTDAYAKRIFVKPLSGCRFGDNLQATYERASKNAPFIIKAFNEKGTDPRIGIYLAMIESEHCVCLQSPTGPLGMFQFTFATAKLHFVPNDGIIKTASVSSPDDRCKPEPAAKAAASYMKALTGRFGTGPASVPLAIGSYNSGEGGLSANLQKALDSNSGLPRDFWTLIANGEKLSAQFQSENFKYVPKFFAAAIVGENPQDFGLNLRPLSTYSQ